MFLLVIEPDSPVRRSFFLRRSRLIALDFKQRPRQWSLPAPQQFFSWVSNAGKSLSAAASPRITVTSFPFLRFSIDNRAVCRSGETTFGCVVSGGQRHSVSGRSHRSQWGGRSKGVPASSRISSSGCFPRFVFTRKVDWNDSISSRRSYFASDLSGDLPLPRIWLVVGLVR